MPIFPLGDAVCIWCFTYHFVFTFSPLVAAFLGACAYLTTLIYLPFVYLYFLSDRRDAWSGEFLSSSSSAGFPHHMHATSCVCPMSINFTAHAHPVVPQGACAGIQRHIKTSTVIPTNCRHSYTGATSCPLISLP